MPARRIPRWTPAELAILRDHYPDGGAEAVRRHLPHRSWYAIYVQAHKRGYRRPPAATNATAPKPKLQGRDLEEAVRLREQEGWSFARIGEHFGVSEAGANNAIHIALCTRRGFTPAERDAKGRLTPEGAARLRYALKKGLKGVEIQLRLGLSAGRVAEERRRYNRELKAAGKALLPPPGGGRSYSGVKLSRALKREIEALFMQGFGAQKIHEQTGVSGTSIGRVRARLVKRLKRKGECLPGCDARGARRVQAESLRFVHPAQIAEFHAMLLERVPVRRAAAYSVIGLCTAMRLRDAFAEELRAEGRELPPPGRPGRIKGGAYPVDPLWPPRGAPACYEFRALLASMSFDEAKAAWRRKMREQREAERQRPRSFEEQLARIRRGEIGLAPAIPRVHLDTTRLRPEERPPV